MVLFKHDPVCPISANAYQELSRLGGEIPLIDVEGAEAEVTAAGVAAAVREHA